MAAGDLTTLQNALARIGLSADTATGDVARLISAISSEVQTFLGYQVATQAYTRTFNGVRQRAIFLPDRPVTAVSALSIDAVNVPAAASAVAQGFVLDPSNNSVALRGYEFCRGVQNVTISYTAGETSTPPIIEQATLDWIAESYAATQREPGLEQWSAGDQEESFKAPATELKTKIVPMPQVVYNALWPLARVTPT